MLNLMQRYNKKSEYANFGVRKIQENEKNMQKNDYGKP